MNRKEHLTEEGLIKVLSIKESINLGLSDIVKSAFFDIVAVERPIISNQKILDPNWFAGFASGEGCFQITLIKTTSNQSGYWVQLSFQLSQHTRDIELIDSIKEYLDCGQTTVYDNHNYIRYTVSNISDIMEKVLPFFEKYLIVGVKSQDYEDFKQVVLMVKDKKPWTSDPQRGFKKNPNLKSLRRSLSKKKIKNKFLNESIKVLFLNLEFSFLFFFKASHLWWFYIVIRQSILSAVTFAFGYVIKFNNILSRWITNRIFDYRN